MTHRLSGYATSFLFHVLVVATAFGLSNSLSPKGKPLTIDFRIDSLTAKVVEKSRAPQKKIVKKIIPAPKRELIVPKPPPKKIVKVIPKPQSVVPKEPVPLKKPEPPAEEVVETVEKIAEVELGEKEVEAINEISEIAFQQQLRAQFLQTHFQFIRKHIQNKVVYPMSARKMGWQGKVVIKFIVCEDGRVINVEIIESSGFSLLDNNAIKSVRNAAPFPKPPVRTELIIPIRFGLV